jgi:hypothetical protein
MDPKQFLSDRTAAGHYSALCTVISSKNVIVFEYTDEDGTTGERIVEPHLVGVDSKGRYLLSAYQVGGIPNKSRATPWGTYFLNKMSRLVVTGKKFTGPRIGYNPSDPTMSRILFRLG